MYCSDIVVPILSHKSLTILYFYIVKTGLIILILSFIICSVLDIFSWRA